MKIDREEQPENNLAKYASYFYELKQLVSVTQNDYQILYLGFIRAVENYLSDKPALFTQSLQRAIKTLKIRRAFTLPIGSDAETCYQQQEVWTYALFTAALLFDCISTADNKNNVLDIAEQLIPKVGFDWIKENELAFSQWSSFLKKDYSENNIFEKIIFYQDKLENNNNLNSIHINQIQLETIEEEKIVAIELDKEKAETKTHPDKFIEWLRDEIAANKLSVNKANSLIQHVEAGILLIMPNLYNQFLKACGYSPNALEKKKILNEIMNCGCFIKNSANNLMHTYFTGDWSVRDQVEGLLISPDFLFTPEQMPEINTLWKADTCLV